MKTSAITRRAAIRDMIMSAASGEAVSVSR